MSGDLIAGAVAIGLGVVVVVVGLRRNLAETTREGLPQFEGGSERATATLGLYAGGERKRRPPSPRQLRWLASLYLLIALAQGTAAILSPDGNTQGLATAGLFALCAVALLVRSRFLSRADLPAESIAREPYNY